jgi:hypothetical protein
MPHAKQNYIFEDAFFDHLEKVYDHKHICALKGKMRLQSKKHVGLATNFTFRCTKCDLEMKASTHEEKGTNQLNEGAVFGSISAGVGHQQMEEIMAHMGIHFMTRKLYNKKEYMLYEVCN